MKKTLTLIALMVALAGLAFGQVTMIPTTLSSAISSTSTNTVVVAAATGLNSNSYALAGGTSYLWVDGEFMSVNAVNSTTLTVTRGYGGTRAMTHASGTLVFAGPANFFSQSKPGLLPGGSCTRTNFPALPRPDTASQTVFDCVGGVFVFGTGNSYVQTQPLTVSQPPVGGTLYTGINTNGTTLTANTQYCTEVDLPQSMVVTGIGVLNGTTASTDLHAVFLADATGKLLYQSAKAGATAATASNYQNFAFTLDSGGNTIAKPYVVGPGRYYGCVQTNGTTATIRMAVTGQADGVLTGSTGSITFGTFTAFTAPTTFTTAVGPFIRLY